MSRKVGTPNKPRHKMGIMQGKPLFIYELRGYSTPCWTWQRVKNFQGYGCSRYKGEYTSAHIAMFKLYGGVIPTGMQLDHLCKNRDCVRPDHLEIVTPVENARRAKSTKLTLEAVAEIRRLLPTRTQKDIASLFGVTRSCIHHVKKGSTWRS